MEDLELELHAIAMDEFGLRVGMVPADRWDAPTPCSDWTVRDLVNHLVTEQLWVPPLLAGETVESVGDRFAGDRLGEDPVARWTEAAAAAQRAFAEPGALDRDVHLSYGTVPARHYCMEMATDLAVHAWDLARALGADDRVDPRLMAAAYDHLAPMMDGLAGSGLFAEPVPVPDDADQQARTLALTGRRP
ncbi:TIGR03086 family protein [Sphaerisporangium melleum]|uniref:TIGR03086 family protein n=1 Tax=Sphaerisporangium melleum TaxID=321316 RepID=A0A917QSZ2_9ACTN|nr:TIGR03086 family metal-binding protein [Sphaerisporangium melleum]GGK67041.1 TIGR03086 family protein [Sphaerisporangium melleum]GII68520.1 TIGR03086 family protein [Sphaerisporangium melleum]